MGIIHSDEFYYQNIRNYLIQRAHAVQVDANLNRLSLAGMSENFYVVFLNTLLGLSLKNANDGNRNAPGIDLIDHEAHVVAQVSVTCSRKKVQDSIDSFDKPDGIWQFYFVPITEKAPKYKSDFKLPYGLRFDRSSDILDITRIMELANSIDKLEKLSLLVEKYSNAEHIKEEQHQDNLRDKLDKLLLETWKHHRSFKLMQTDEIDKRLFPRVQDSHQFEALGKRRDDETDSPVWTIIRESWKEPENHPIMIEGGGGIGKTVTLFSFTSIGKDTITAPAVYVPMFDLIDQKGNVINLSSFFLSSNSLSPLTKVDRKGICALAEKDWKNGPSLLVLLDGFNEVPGPRRWEVLKMLREWHKANLGAQLIAVSRPMDNLSLKTAFGKETISIVLSELSKESVIAYLNSLKEEGVRIPELNSPIWNTIVFPLFLNLYIKADRLQNQQAWKDYPLHVIEATGPASIIWNFLQRELLRHEDESWILRCAVSCEYLAPILANYMIQNNEYTVSLNEAVEVIRKAAAEMNTEKLPKHLMEIISWWGTQKLSLKPPAFLKKQDWADTVLRESGLLIPFHERRSGKIWQKTEMRFEFLHQNFRDCLAGLHLVNQSEICTEIGLPEIWRSRQSDLALNYVAELIDSYDLDNLWEANRTSQQSKNFENGKNHTATCNLLELYRRNEKNAKSLDFSGMDLRGLCLTNYLGKNGKPLPLFRSAVHSNGTILDRTVFQSTGHTDPISALALLPDGRVVSGSEDYTLRVWDATSGQCLQTLTGHSNAVNCIDVFPDGHVVSASADRTLRIWDIGSGQCLHTLEGHTAPVTCMAILTDTRIVSGSWDCTLRVWDATTGKCLHILKGHRRPIRCVRTLPDGCVISSSDDSTLRVWNIASGKCLHILSEHRIQVRCLAVFPNGYAVSGSDDRTLRVWDTASGQCLQTLIGHSGPITCVATLSDGSVVSGSNDCTLRVWDITSGQCLQTIKGHSQPVNQISILSRGRLVSCSDDCTLRIWDINSAQCLQVLEGHRHTVRCVVALPDERLVSGSSDNSLHVWDVASGQSLQTMVGRHDWIRCLAVLPDGRVVSGSDDSTLRVFSTVSGKCLQTLEGHSRPVNCIAVLSNGHVISGSDDRTLREWDIETGLCLKTMEGHSGQVTCMAVLSDDRIVSGSRDGTLRIWDAASGQCLKTLEGHSWGVTCVAVLTNGCVISGSEDQCLRIWDASADKSLQTLVGHNNPANCVTVFPDGRVAIGSWDHTLRVFDATSGQNVQILKGHKSIVRCVTALSNRRMVSGSGDCTLRIWDTDSGKCLQIMHGHTKLISCVAVLPNGQLVSGSGDGTIRIWNADNGDCVDMLEAIDVPVSGMDFSDAELTEDLAGLLYHNGATIPGKDYLRWAEANHICVDQALH